MLNIDALKRINKIIREFFEKKIWIATAESCTGGYIAHMITNISGASKIFERGVVTYSNQSKIDILNVEAKAIEEHGAVSEIVAWQMANNIRKLANVNIGIGVTGIGGPSGATPEKPLGLVYIGFSTEKETFVKKHIFKTDRLNFKEKVLEEIIVYLESFL
jgi:nicotinamide-nucleotide amidase